MSEKPTKAWLRSEAKFRAGLILESVLAADWAGDPSVVKEYGQKTADLIAEEMSNIAAKMVKS